MGNDDPGAWLSGQLRVLGRIARGCDAPTTLKRRPHPQLRRAHFLHHPRPPGERSPTSLLRPRIAAAPHPNSIVLLVGRVSDAGAAASYPQLIRELQALGYQVALDTNWPPQDWSSALRAEVAELDLRLRSRAAQ